MGRTIGTNAAYQRRKPWRNTPGGGATKAQKGYVRLLEHLLGRVRRDLSEETRADVSDYIFLLERKARKAGFRKRGGRWRR